MSAERPDALEIKPVIIDGTVHIRADDNPDGLADWVPFLAVEDVYGDEGSRH